MSYHARQRPRLNPGFIDRAVGFHPGLAVHRIDGRDQVLVPLVLSVTGEMLDGGGKTHFLYFPGVGRAHLPHPRRIASEGAGIGDGAAKIGINVDDRRESPVRSYGPSLRAADLRHFGRHLHVIRGRNLHRGAQKGSLLYDAVPALFQIRGNERRNIQRLTQLVGKANRPLRRNHPVHTSAGLQDVQDVF